MQNVDVITKCVTTYAGGMFTHLIDTSEPLNLDQRGRCFLELDDGVWYTFIAEQVRDKRYKIQYGSKKPLFEFPNEVGGQE